MRDIRESKKEGKDMDVRINRLLNSAERFVQDKKESKEADKTSSLSPDISSQTKEAKSDFAVSLPIQYHNIQTKLTELQKQLSREQAKSGILEANDTPKEDLIKILFENEPLFPELTKAGSGSNFNAKDALTASQGSVQSIMQELKKKEVEGENIFSLGMILNPDEFKGKIGSLSASAQKPISESVVKRLLGG